MASIYCEFCGAEIKDIRSPEKLLTWLRRGRRADVVRCERHGRTSKLSDLCRTHDPLTGELTQAGEWLAANKPPKPL